MSGLWSFLLRRSAPFGLLAAIGVMVAGGLASTASGVDDGAPPSIAQGTPAFSPNWVASGSYKVVGTDPSGIKSFRLTSDATPAWSVSMPDRGCGLPPAVACLTTETLSVPVTALKDGPNEITATATDTEGRVATKVVGTLRVDRSKPTIASKSGTLATDGAWFDGGGQGLSFTAHDDYSGVRQTEVGLTPAIVARDSFSRNATGGFGSPDLGAAPWVVRAGDAANFAIDGVSARVTVPTGTSQTIAAYPSGGLKDQDLGIDVSFPERPATGEMAAALVLRYTSFSSYRVGLVADVNGKLSIRTDDRRTGTRVFDDTDTGLRFEPGAVYRLRATAVGGNPTRLTAKAWKLGSSEPVQWAVNGTNANLGDQVGGGYGVEATQTALPTTDIAFDNFVSSAVSVRTTFDSRFATNPDGSICGTSGCPVDFTRPFIWDASGELEGRHKVTLVAYDPLLWQTTTVHTVGVDRTPPEMQVSGPLKDEATHLRHGDPYPVHIEATDGNTSSDLTARSGVKSIEVVVTDLNGAEMTRWSDEQGCATDSCAMTRDWTFDTAAYPAGRYTVRVTATDRLADGSSPADHKRTFSWPIKVNKPPRLHVSGNLWDNRGRWVDGSARGLDFTVEDEDLEGGSVELRVDGVLADRETRDGTPGNWTGSASFTGSNYDDGSHTVRVVATDGDGTTDEQTFEVKTDKTAPSADLAGDLWESRDLALEERSYDLDLTSGDGSSGVKRASLSVDDDQISWSEQPCEPGACGLTYPFHYVNSGNAAARAVVVKVTDQVGNETTKKFAAGEKTDVCEQTADATQTDSAATDRAVDAVEDANPAAIAPSEPTTDEGQTVEPSLTPAGGDNLAATDTLAAATVSKDPNDGFAVKRDDTKVCVTPTDTSPDANKGEVVNDDAVVYANTGEDSDTVVRPTSKGVETFTAIRSEDASEDYTWEVNLAGDQEIRETPDGGVQVVDPTPVANDPGTKPADEPATQGQLDSLKATGEAPADTQLSDPIAEMQAEQAAQSAGTPATPATTTEPDPQAQGIIDEQQGQPPADPPAGTPADDPATGDTVVQQAVDQAKDNTRAEASDELAQMQASAVDNNQTAAASETAAEQSAATEPVVVAEFQPPESVDANGDPVDTTLEVVGDTVTMHVDHVGNDTAYPVVADPWVTVVRYELVWRCCRPVYRTEWRAWWSQDWVYAGYWYSSWIFQHAWRVHIGWGFWIVYDPWWGYVLMGNYGWMPFYIQQWVPHYYTVQVFDHWEGWLEWQRNLTLEWRNPTHPGPAQVYLDSEERPTAAENNMLDAAEGDSSDDPQVSAAYNRRGCRVSRNRQPYEFPGGAFAWWNQLRARFCWDRRRHKVRQSGLITMDNHVSPGAKADGIKVTSEKILASYTAQWKEGGYNGRARQVHMEGDAKMEQCDPIFHIGCIDDWTIYMVSWGHDDGSAIERNHGHGK